MSRGPDAATLLERALLASARSAGLIARVEDWRTVRWAPATFTGARHEMTLVAPAGAAFDQWMARLPEAELPMRGHFVAEVSVDGRAPRGDAAAVRLSILTVEES